jgi:hypothetical protein
VPLGDLCRWGICAAGSYVPPGVMCRWGVCATGGLPTGDQCLWGIVPLGDICRWGVEDSCPTPLALDLLLVAFSDRRIVRLLPHRRIGSYRGFLALGCHRGLSWP